MEQVSFSGRCARKEGSVQEPFALLACQQHNSPLLPWHRRQTASLTDSLHLLPEPASSHCEQVAKPVIFHSCSSQSHEQLTRLSSVYTRKRFVSTSPPPLSPNQKLCDVLFSAHNWRLWWRWGPAQPSCSIYRARQRSEQLAKRGGSGSDSGKRGAWFGAHSACTTHEKETPTQDSPSEFD